MLYFLRDVRFDKCQCWKIVIYESKSCTENLTKMFFYNN